MEINKLILTELILRSLFNYILKIGKEYGLLKLRLAKLFPNDTHQYQQAKKPYVDMLINRMNEWETKL